MKRVHLGLVALLPVLMTLVLISCIQSTFIPPSYASQEEEGVRTLRVKAYLENSVVEHNNKETVYFQVADQKTHQPIGGAITSATVSYADGKTVRYFSVPTDASGRSSISWKIERNAPDGLYNVAYSVFETGYEPAYFGGSFSVVAHNVNYDCLFLSANLSSSSCSSSSSSSTLSYSPSSTLSSSYSPSSSSSSTLSSSYSPSSSSSSTLSSSYSPSSSSSSFDHIPLILDLGGPSMQIANSQPIKQIKPSQMDLGGPSMQIANSQPIKPSQK
jgi:hypothetical protein